MDMRERSFHSLLDALAFVSAHGGAVCNVRVNDLPSRNYSEGESSWVRLADGSYFGVEAHAEGPYSLDTPDLDMEVRMIGFE